MAKTQGPASVYQLKITLKGIRPPVWRRVQVGDGTLADLHHVIQACMGWGHAHLHAFEVGGQEYGEPDPSGWTECADERRVRLGRLVAAGSKKFTYTYDFGDDWQHVVQVEKVLPAEAGQRYPRCVTGKRACPPEDCGGPWGYQGLLEILGDPKHPEHAERLEWAGGAIDPEAFDLDAVNQRLATLG